MSDITTGSLPDTGDALGGFECETPTGKTASVEVTGRPVNCARVDVRVESGRHWVFGVNDGTAVLVMVLNEVGKNIDADLPNWIEPVIQRTGLDGVQQ